MKDFKGLPTTSLGWVLVLHFSVQNSQLSWVNLTSCQVYLPPHLEGTILLSGGSDTAQVLFQRRLDLPTSIVGRSGRLLWNPSSQLPTMVSIVLAVGHTRVTVLRCMTHKSLAVAWSLFPKPSRNLGLSPRNRARISGANKIFGTTFVSEYIVPGLASLFALATKPATRNFVSQVRELVELLLSTCRQHQILSRVKSWVSSFGRIRDY